jgi:tetratricopeptide (TPR) repeat protein
MATLVFSILLFLASIIFQSRKKLLVVFVSFFFVSAFVALFQISRLLFGVGFLSFGYLTETASNTLGKWNELAVFFGLSTILSLMSLAMLKLQTRARIGLVISFLLSLIMLVLVNLSVVWYVVGAITLVLFVYFLFFEGSKLSTVNVDQLNSEETKMKTAGRTISFAALVVLIVTFVFAFTPVGANVTSKMTQKYNINNLEVRPSWEATLDLTKKTLKTNPFLGIGPNRFSTTWQLNRPDINLTNFWNMNFYGGIGFIPTAIVETGILGIVVWFLFLASFIFYGFRAFLRKSNDRVFHYLTAASFIGALYLWIISIVYMPGASVIALTFFFTGLSIATAYMGGLNEPKSFSLFKYKRLNFLVATVLVLILVASVGLGYLFVQKTLSFSYFQRGLVLASNKDTIDASASYMLRAESIAPNDVYYRSIAELNIARLNEIISSTANEKSVSDEVKNRFQSVLSSGLEASKRAQIWDPENYQNWVSVARVYETIVPVGVTGAFDSAKAAYEEAAKRSPRNPAIYLALGRLEASQNNLSKAKENINKTLELKSNFLEAIFFLSQIDAAQGNIQASANSIQTLSGAFPNDPSISFRLGILKYQLKDYAGAVAAFEKAISVAPIYANARYFLGLSYEKVARVPDAIIQFEELAKTNPDNEEVKSILTNLKAGKDAFAAVKSPLDNKPEKRKKLPVEETTN